MGNTARISRETGSLQVSGRGQGWVVAVGFLLVTLRSWPPLSSFLTYDLSSLPRKGNQAE